MDGGTWQAAVQGAVEPETPEHATLDPEGHGDSPLPASHPFQDQFQAPAHYGSRGPKAPKRARNPSADHALPLPHPLTTPNCHRLCAVNKLLSLKGHSPCETGLGHFATGLASAHTPP